MAARAYLLHLVGCTIFADKSVTLVSVFYLGVFVDLRLTRGYSWAAAALTHMYEQLQDCSYANIKQLVGRHCCRGGFMSTSVYRDETYASTVF